MKLKILITPIVFIAVVVLSIWYIKPTTDEWMAKRKILENKQVFTQEIKAKSEKVSVWKKTLEGDVADQNVIFNYVPKEAKEEEIIDNLNSMASESGVILNNVSLIFLKDLSVGNEPVPVAVGNIDSSATLSPDEEIMDSQLTENNIEVDMDAFGEYDNLKSFLDKTSSFRRFNKLGSLKISMNDASSSADASTKGLLLAKISFVFNYAKDGSTLVTSINDGVFGEESLDMSIAKSIEDTKSVATKSLSVGQFGRANPFIK